MFLEVSVTSIFMVISGSGEEGLRVIEASAFSPGHLTGFFQICDEADDPLHRGARGSGCSINLGVRTRVVAEPAESTSFRVRINGVEAPEAVVSFSVLRRMIPLLDRPHRIAVDHEAQIPIGAGFGASGGGALSLALAFNEAFGLGLTALEAARVAHLAEIECRTGLGTVLAELVGGFGAIVRPGGPGIGEAVKFDHRGLSVVCVHLGPIQTREVLMDPLLRARVNELGGRLVDELVRDPSPALFMSLSRRFAEHLGLITPRLRRILDVADGAGVTFTMSMLGETAFALLDEGDAERMAGILERSVHGGEILSAEIDGRGARVI
jgi:pantoate kinase